MAEISLRAYIKQINELVENDNLDEAIAHCRYILQTYPKHLEVYRLLGKAYLEANRYGDATDILQRVLSAVPDDFVAHVGMSIVREDEGNLDAAIWHMERAFETNPANPVIQQELRRLIGRRDGLEPHKVRLTRGALARMYAHGELYQQAIAELRSALQEEPDRPDLQVQLAEMYWRLSQPSESMTVCKVILDHLPFCLEANRLTAAHLKSTGKHDQAAPYHRRIASLDPYLAFLDSPLSDAESVDASAVHIEHLDWHPGQPVPMGETSKPSWATSLGVDLLDEEPEPTEPEAAPSLDAAIGAAALGGVLAAADQKQEQEAKAADPGPPPDESIPDWMKDAGWVGSSGDAVEEPVSFSDEELSALEAGKLPAESQTGTGEDSELAPAEIPSWLQDIAPGDVDKIAETDVVSEGEAQAPDWLVEAQAAGDEETEEDQELQESLEGISTTAQDEIPSEAIDDGKEVPSWLEQEPPGATETIVTWLGDRGPTEQAEIESEVEGTADDEIAAAAEEPPLEEEAQEEIPTWLEEAVAEEPKPSDYAREDELADETPGWLTGVVEAAAEESETPETTSEDEPVVEAPGWLAGVSEAAAEELEPLETTPEDEPVVEAPGWLAGVAEAAAEDEGTSPLELDQFREQFDFSVEGVDESEEDALEEEALASAGGVPDWLQAISVGEEGVEEIIPTTDEPIPAEPEPVEASAFPEDADIESPPQEEAMPEPDVFPEPEPMEGSTPDWLSISPESEETEAEITETAESEAPSWLAGLAVSEDETPEPEISEPDAPDWLVGIAEGPSAESDEVSGAPDWLSGIAEEEGPAEEAVTEDSADEGWLDRLSEVGQEGSDEITISPDTPDWLSSDSETEVAGGEPIESDAPDWLEEVAQPEEEIPSPATESIDADLPSEMPEVQEQDDEDVEVALDWLKESAEEVSPEPPELVESPPAEEPTGQPAASTEIDDEEVMDWLDGLAAKQDLSEPSEMPEAYEVPRPVEQPTIEEVRAEIPEEPEQGLEWLEQLAAERGMDIDVGFESAPPSEPIQEIEESPPLVPEPPVQEEVEGEYPPSEVPDWLVEMSEVQEQEAAEALLESEPAVDTPAEVMESQEVAPEDIAEEPVTIPETSEPIDVQIPSAIPDEEPEILEAEVIPEVKIEAPSTDIEAGEVKLDQADIIEGAVDAETEIVIQEPPVIEDIAEETAKPEPEVTPQEIEIPEEPFPVETEAELDLSVPEWLRQPPEDIKPTQAEGEAEIPSVEGQPEPDLSAEPSPPPELEPEAQVPAPPEEPEPAKPTTEPVEAPIEVVDVVQEPVDLPTEVVAEVEIPPISLTPEQKLELPRKDLAAGKTDEAVSAYAELIKEKDLLDLVIDDLQLALEREPDNPSLWQTLGDAYMNKDQLTEAIEAYRRGMESA